MPDFEALLRIQGHDTTLVQLNHRRGHLPQHTEAAEVRAQIDTSARQSANSRAAHADLTAKMAHIEGQVHDLDTKIEGLNAQMFSSSARSPRELQAIEADIESIRRHRSKLEDAELELIDAFEPHDKAVRASDEQVNARQARLVELDAEIVAAQAALDAEAAAVAAERGTLASAIDAGTIELYEKVRTANRGVGAARLEHGTCMSCRLKIAAVELDRIRHLATDALVRCDECGAILVR